MTKVATRIALLPRLKQQVILRNNISQSSQHRFQSKSLNNKYLKSGSSSQRDSSCKEPIKSSSYRQHNLIRPLVLDPYRHRRRNSSDARYNSVSTSEIKQQLAFNRASPQNSQGNSKMLTQWHTTEKQQSRGTSITFRRWLKKHIQTQRQKKSQPKIQQPSRVLNKRQLIDKLSMRGLYRNRTNHERLDFAVDQKQNYWDQVQESCIIRTEEENQHQLCSMISILKLIGS